ncbi:MAG: nucleotidyltransferase family protein [Pseudomonadota bacterium]
MSQSAPKPTHVDQAVVLSAGLGTRMQPLTLTRPKPLISVAGKTLLDHALDALDSANITHAVVNVHYLADQIVNHVAGRTAPKVTISDERSRILDSGGGVAQAQTHLDPKPFFVLNADSFWLDRHPQALPRMIAKFDPTQMDMLMLLARHEDSVGFAGAGDFFMDDTGRLTRRGSAPAAPCNYAGAVLMRPGLFDDWSGEPFSLNRTFDHAIARGRLHGLWLDGLWLHVGTPEAIGDAETAIGVFRNDEASRTVSAGS